MARSLAPRSVRAPAAFEREARLVREAIAMVAAGAAPRVVVAGIRHGEQLYGRLSRTALEAGVRLLPLRGRNRTLTGIAVEPIRL